MKGVLWVIPHKFGKKFEFAVRVTGKSKALEFSSKKDFYKYLRHQVGIGHSDSVRIIETSLMREGKIVPIDLNTGRVLSHDEALQLEEDYLRYLAKKAKIRQLALQHNKKYEGEKHE